MLSYPGTRFGVFNLWYSNHHLSYSTVTEGTQQSRLSCGCRSAGRADPPASVMLFLLSLIRPFGPFQNADASYDFSSNDPFPFPRYTDDWFNR